MSYKVVDGTSYHPMTDEKLIRVLERCRRDGTRIRVFLGNNGKNWMEENNVVGYVGRSTGIKTPLLVYNNRSLGGVSLLDNCILAVQETKTKDFIYRGKDFKVPDIEIKKDRSYHHLLPYHAIVDGETFAAFPDKKTAENWRDFMQGKRTKK